MHLMELRVTFKQAQTARLLQGHKGSQGDGIIYLGKLLETEQWSRSSRKTL